MNASLIATMLAATALPQPFSTEGFGKPPQPFTEQVILPGEIPSTVRSLSGTWRYHYALKGAHLENGRSDIMVHIELTLHEDLRYELRYSAHWDLPRGLAFIPLPKVSAPKPHLVKGRSVKENGRFLLASDVLLLEPASTEFQEVLSASQVNQQSLPNEKHTWVVRLDEHQGARRIAIAGRCASYQVDPVCAKTPLVWYPMRFADTATFHRLPR